MRGQHGYWYMATFTAPGAPEHNRFVPGKRGNHGPCNCGQHGLTMGQWNRQESACWNRLRLSLSRLAEGGVQYVTSVEVQEKRADKMLHRHGLIWSPKPLAIHDVQALALRAGYGCSIQWQRPYSGTSAANYVAKYITKSAGQRSSIPWQETRIDHDTGEVTLVGKRATYRTWSRSQRWGVSIQELRDLMATQARARAHYLAELEDALAADHAQQTPVAPAPHPPD